MAGEASHFGLAVKDMLMVVACGKQVSPELVSKQAAGDTSQQLNNTCVVEEVERVMLK